LGNAEKKMKNKKQIFFYTEPWPNCWIKIQWDIALLTSCWNLSSNNKLHLIWKESFLINCVTPIEFKLHTEEFTNKLLRKIGANLSWEVSKLNCLKGHEVQINNSLNVIKKL